MPDLELVHINNIADPGAHEFMVELGNRLVRGFLVRKGSQVYAYVNRCPHAGQPLNRSPEAFLGADNRLIMCRSHGAMFEIESGLCIEGICLGQSLQKLPIHVVDGVITIALV